MTENIPTYPDLAGKVALVTGGSGGYLGRDLPAARHQRHEGGGAWPG